MTAPLHVAAWADDRRNGPCRDDPPLSSTETDDGKGQGGGERRVERRHGPEDSSPQGGKHGVLKLERRRGCPCRLA